MAKFGEKSLAHLNDVDERLRLVHTKVIEYYDHSIDDGLRTIVEQEKNVARGVSKTMDSKHLPGPDGKSRATDSRPYPLPDWPKVEKCLAAIKLIDPTLGILRFYHFQGIMKGHAKALGIDLRQGIDWDSDNDLANQTFFDLPHNELR
jgi:peptidoglycan L-alanyl-D-glutamate endopeptidase CwlK